MTLPAFRSYMRYESVEPAKNRYRCYVLRLQPDLFGNLALVRTWGRIGTLGTTRLVTADADADGQRWVEQLVHHWGLHGYRLVVAD